MATRDEILGGILDPALFEAAAAGVAAHVPELGPLRWERWADPVS